MFWKLLVGIVTLPGMILAGFVRLLVALLSLPWQLRAKTAATLRCPGGHSNPVMGRWNCTCGATYAGHAFAPCPVCRLPAGWMRCEACGLAIRSPWKNEA